jgi:hypothetical protein
MFARLACGVAASAMLFSAVPALAQDFSAQRLSDHIKYLSDDSLEGRFPGKVGEQLALAYLQAQYEAMGLEPGGPDGQWLQPVDLLRLTPARAPTISWTGPDGVAHVVDAGMTARAGAADGHVKLDGLPVVFAGYGVVAPERTGTTTATWI